MALASITITQAFLGAPLQFQPALASREFAELLDAFVTGSASKQEKLSEMTIDFYNNATVDLNTGALVKTYYVLAPAAVSPWTTFGQSPAQSQSSGLSPSIYTPSPSSSAANLADSGYGSFSAPTPPNRSRNGAASSTSSRVAKKVKKDTKKAAEMRLPGFSIMTKDGVDVTNSAGRGTKSKEQREHAHLMRIMKACGDCKRKKIKCDPSHRRSLDTTTTTYDFNSTLNTSGSSSSSSARPAKSSSANSPAHPTPPPPSSASWEYADASFYDLPSSGNAMDDFVLFPDESASWNAQAGQLENYDLADFNFDISNAGGLDDSAFLDLNPSFSFIEEPHGLSATHQTNRPIRSPLSTYDQYDLTQWNENQDWLSVSQSEPLSSSSQDSPLSAASRWMSDKHILPTLSDTVDANVSFSTEAFVDRSSPGNSSTMQESATSPSSADWSPLEGSVNDNRTTPQESPGLPSVIKRHRLRDVQFGSWMDLSGSSISTEQALHVQAGTATSAGLPLSEGSLSYLDIKLGSRSQLSQSPEYMLSDTNGLPYARSQATSSGITQWRERLVESNAERLSVQQTHARVQSLTTPGVESGGIVEVVGVTQSGLHNGPASGLIDLSSASPGVARSSVALGQSVTYHGLVRRLPDHAGSGSQVQRPHGTMERSGQIDRSGQADSSGQMDRSGQQSIPSTMSSAKIQREVEYAVDALLSSRAALRPLSTTSKAKLESIIDQAQDILRDTPSTTSKASSQTSSAGAASHLAVDLTKQRREDGDQQLVSQLIGNSRTTNTGTKRIGGGTTDQAALNKSEHQQQQQAFHNVGSTFLSVSLLLASCLLAGCLGNIMTLLFFLSHLSNQQPASLIRQYPDTYESLPSSAARLSSVTDISRLAFAAMLIAAYAPTVIKTFTKRGHRTASTMLSCSSAVSGYIKRSREGVCTPTRLV